MLTRTVHCSYKEIVILPVQAVQEGFRGLLLLSWDIGNLSFFSMAVFAVAGLPSYFPVHFTFKSTKREKRSQITCSTNPVTAFKCRRSKPQK